ncbi:hypothetical protein [Gudongella sp. SC589]|uniref:hypothetical protein n=1 Tax=Gudongella sp. SC589 TaxID=3385990 RepID=UPI003904D9BB
MNEEYIILECNKCKLSFIIPADGIRKAEVMGNYFACPLCHGGVSKVGAYEDLRECMEKVNTYERVNGRVRQTRYK